jgi:hypothetical protein
MMLRIRNLVERALEILTMLERTTSVLLLVVDSLCMTRVCFRKQQFVIY